MDLVAPNAQHSERGDGKHPGEEADGELYNGENVLAKENMEELADTLLEYDDANGAISLSIMPH